VLAHLLSLAIVGEANINARIASVAALMESPKQAAYQNAVLPSWIRRSRPRALPRLISGLTLSIDIERSGFGIRDGMRREPNRIKAT